MRLLHTVVLMESAYLGDSCNVAVVTYVPWKFVPQRAQANARRPKRSRLTLGTSSSNPPAERSERGGVWRRSSAARYSGVPLYMALCTSTSSLKSIRFLTGNQCNCRSIVVMDCRSPRRICLTIRAADRWTISRRCM